MKNRIADDKTGDENGKIILPTMGKNQKTKSKYFFIK
jgi:hypothetical protein